MDGYDIIGDVHGEGERLEGLLHLLGYREDGGAYRHPSRQAIFVGDLIDRGPHQRKALRTVRRMQRGGSALVVMGNHEFNAIAYATEDPRRPGRFLRDHDDKRTRQHGAFLTQLTPAQRAKRIEWFTSLPLWLDLDGLRVVHACWHEPSIDLVQAAFSERGLTRQEFFVQAATKGTELYDAVEVLLKGPEMDLARYGLPPFLDKGGDSRKRARIRWWNADGTTVRDLAEIASDAPQEDGAPYPTIPESACAAGEAEFEYHGAIPVVFGHYWRQWPPAEPLDRTGRTACVDFSAGNGGPLVAYRWDGEDVLSESKFVAFPGDPR